jgi:hypothetical protein
MITLKAETACEFALLQANKGKLVQEKMDKQNESTKLLFDILGSKDQQELERMSKVLTDGTKFFYYFIMISLILFFYGLDNSSRYSF